MRRQSTLPELWEWEKSEDPDNPEQQDKSSLDEQSLSIQEKFKN